VKDFQVLLIKQADQTHLHFTQHYTKTSVNVHYVQNHSRQCQKIVNQTGVSLSYGRSKAYSLNSFAVDIFIGYYV